MTIHISSGIEIMRLMKPNKKKNNKIINYE